MSTMVALKNSGGGFVSLTSEIDEKWAFDIHDFVKNSNGSLSMLPNKKVQGVTYLGTNVPLWMPSTSWIRSVISPFVDQSSYFKSIRTDFRDDRIFLTIKKKPNYESYSVLYRDTLGVQYNPESVDSFLGMTKRLLWLEASHGLPIEEVEEKKILHSPWFVDYDGQWEEIDGLLWKVKDKKVQDVKLPGTYTSRTRKAPPAGYTWSSYNTVGEYIVQYNSLSPRQVLGLTLKRGVETKFSCASFDDLVIDEYPIVRIDSRLGHYYNFLEGDPVKSEEGLLLSRTYNETVIDYAYVDSQGNHYSSHLRRDDAILVSLGGEKYRVPFVPGEVMKLSCFGRKKQVMVLPEKMVGGQYLAFPSNESFVNHLHLLSLFTSRVITVESLIDAKQDPEYGGFSTENGDYEVFETKLLANKIRQNGSLGLTPSMLALESSFPVTKVFHYLTRMPKVWIWKDGKVCATQFIHENALQMRFGGDLREGYWDGKYWNQILELLTSSYFQSRHSFDFSPGVDLQSFKYLLEINLCSVKIVCNEVATVLKVQKGPF